VVQGDGRGDGRIPLGRRGGWEEQERVVKEQEVVEVEEEGRKEGEKAGI